MRKFMLDLVFGLVVLGVANMGHTFSIFGGGGGSVQNNPVSNPVTMLLLGIGLIGLAAFGRSKFK